jgi:hypothetical protein
VRDLPVSQPGRMTRACGRVNQHRLLVASKRPRDGPAKRWRVVSRDLPRRFVDHP